MLPNMVAVSSAETTSLYRDHRPFLSQPVLHDTLSCVWPQENIWLNPTSYQSRELRMSVYLLALALSILATHSRQLLPWSHPCCRSSRVISGYGISWKMGSFPDPKISMMSSAFLLHIPLTSPPSTTMHLLTWSHCCLPAPRKDWV